jgi:hypothetical protein
MTRIFILEITSSRGWSRANLKLTSANLNDETGDTRDQRTIAEGDLNIQPLITRHQNIIGDFRSTAPQNHYYGGNPVIPTNINPYIDNTLSTNIQNIVKLIDKALMQHSCRRIYDGFISNMPSNLSEPVRLVISTNHHLVQDLPIENTVFVKEILGKDRMISIVFTPLVNIITS